MNRRSALVMALLAATSAGCQRHPAPVQPQRTARYVVGPAWQGSGGAWFYPREQTSFQTTGLAVADDGPAGRIEADGEAFDPMALTASVQTLPLPSVLRVQDLDTGRIVFVRAIGRGPRDPGRLIALSPAAARLLGLRDGQPAPVSVSLDQGFSQQLQQSLAGAPHLAIAQAPVQAVTEQTLGPPGSTPGASATSDGGALSATDASGPVGAQAVGIPAGVQQGPVTTGALWLDGGRFDGAAAANSVADSMGGEARREGSGRQTVYRVMAGPFRTVSEADAALDRARHSGVTGAHIIVE